MTRPTCPYCAAAWSEAMLAALDRATMPSACACCNGETPGHRAGEAERELPRDDIACAACGKVIFAAPVAISQGGAA